MQPTNTVKCKNTERWHQQIILKLNLLGIRSSFLFLSWVAFTFSLSSAESKPRWLFGLTNVMLSFSAWKKPKQWYRQCMLCISQASTSTSYIYMPPPKLMTGLQLIYCNSFMVYGMYIQKWYILPKLCVYLSCMIIRTNNDYFPKWNKPSLLLNWRQSVFSVRYKLYL